MNERKYDNLERMRRDIKKDRDKVEALLEQIKLILDREKKKGQFFMCGSQQFRMMKAVLLLYDKAMTALSDGITFSRIAETGLFDSLVKMKYEIPNNDLGQFNSLEAQIEESIDSLYE